MRQRIFLERHSVRSVVARRVTNSGLAATLMIKRSLLATVSCLALGAPAAAEVPIWAGSYLGLNGGIVSHRVDTDTVYGSANLANGEPHDLARTTATSGTFGAQVGYNWQSQNFVYGLEADLNWVNERSSFSQGPSFFTVVYNTKLGWLATARLRGGIAFGRTLVYGTGGVAAGYVESSWGVNGSPLIVSNGTRTGWTAGGGVEHFISNQHVTVRAEVLYVDLGSRTRETQDRGYRARFKTDAVVGRLGLNLKW